MASRTTSAPVGQLFARLTVVLLLIASASCVSSDDEAEAPPIELPEGFELVSVRSAEHIGPEGARVVGTTAIVGASPADPRFIEYTTFELAPTDTSSRVAQLIGPAVASESIAINTDGLFAFVDDAGLNTAPVRPALQLVEHGPVINATFRIPVEPATVIIGASASLQPYDIEELIDSITAGDDALPDGMSVIADQPLPSGIVLEAASPIGTTTTYVYEGVAQGWFDYIVRSDPQGEPDALFSQLAPLVSQRPPSNFGINGEPLDPVRTAFWDDGKLVIIRHPDAVPTASVADLFTTIAAADPATLQSLIDSTPVENPTQPDTVPDNPTDNTGPVRAPTDAEMVGLQAFAESQRGVELGQPVAFDFVPVFPTEGLQIDFISTELWFVVESLGLVEDGQTWEDANQARVDRIRGTPGVIALQPTQTETDVVVVHEIVHLLDPPPAEPANNELVSMGQVVSEGNAHRVAYDYLLTLPDDEQQIMMPFPHIFDGEPDPRLSPAVRDIIEFAYDEGRLFMAELAERGGEDLVNDAFDRPPVSTEQVLFPDAWERNEAPILVPRPSAPDGATPLVEGTMGAFVLLLALSNLDAEANARDLTSQWAGDSLVVYEADADVCMDAVIQMDTTEAAAQVGAVLQSQALTVQTDDVFISATFCS